MPVILNADNGAVSGISGLTTSADNSGVLQFQSSGTATLEISTTGNITIPGTGKRILGDFSNATVANRVLFQTSTTNSPTTLTAIPNGSSTISQIGCYDNAADLANSSTLQLDLRGGSDARLSTSRTGTGTFLPLTMYTGGSERLRIDTSGNVGIGTSSPTEKLTVAGAGLFSGALVDDRTSAAVLDFSSGSARLISYGASGVGGIIQFRTGSGGASTTERMRLDSSGNLGLGVTPSAWNIAVALAVGNGALSGTVQAGSLDLVNNVYFNGSSYLYRTSNFATFTRQTATGQFLWYQAPSGTAGNVASFTQAMTLDASGNLGIGTTTTSTGKLIAGLGGGHTFNVEANGVTLGSNNGVLITNYLSQTTRVAGINLAASASNAGEIVFGTASSGTLSERMRIDSSGNLLVAGTTQYGSSVINLTTPALNSGSQTRWGYALGQTTDSRFSYWNHQTDSGGNAGVFYTASSGMNLGIVMIANTNGVRLAQGGTSWSSYSDERLKNVTGEITNALDKVSQIRAVEYSWKSDESNTKRVGFIAQDLQKVLPEVVDEDTEYLQVRYSETVPLLLAAIKEQQAMINDLKAEVEALKARG